MHVELRSVFDGPDTSQSGLPVLTVDSESVSQSPNVSASKRTKDNAVDADYAVR